MRKVGRRIGQAVTVAALGVLAGITVVSAVTLVTGVAHVYDSGTNAGVYVDTGAGRCVGWEVRGHPGPFGSVTHASDVCS